MDRALKLFVTPEPLKNPLTSLNTARMKVLRILKRTAVVFFKNNLGFSVFIQ